MKKSLLFVLLILLSISFMGKLFAQIPVAIGDDTLVEYIYNGASPYVSYSQNFRQQYLIKATEITYDSTDPVVIEGISFDVYHFITPPQLPNYRIRMKHTTQEELTTSFEAGEYTEVYQSDLFIPVLGWNYHAFTTPFEWDETSNIIVDIVCNRWGTTSNNATLYYSEADFNSSLRFDYASPLAEDATDGIVSRYRNNMILSLRELDTHDILAVDISGPTYPTINTSVSYTVKVKNNSPNTLTNYTVKLMELPNNELASMAGISIDPMEEIDFIFDWTPTTALTTQLYGRVEMPDDENPSSDNTPAMIVIVLPEDVLEIGDGDDSGFLPIYTFNNYSYSQTLYMADELQNQRRQIEKIAYHWNGEGSALNSTQWTVYMGHSDKNAFANNTDWIPIEELTEVYQGMVATPSIDLWTEIELNMPFIYNGTDNLVIAVRETKPGFDPNTYFFYNTASTDGRSIRYSDDYTNPNPSDPPAGTLVSAYPNIRMYFDDVPQEPALWVVPNMPAWYFGLHAANSLSTETFTLTNIGMNTLTINSVTVTGDSFALADAFVSTALGFTESIIITVDYNPETAGEHAGLLTISTDHGIHEIILYGSCYDPVISQFPFFEGFEVGNINGSTTITQWDQIIGTEYSSQYWTANNSQTDQDRISRSGEWNITLRHSGESTLLRPIMLQGGQGYSLEFWARQEVDSGASLEVTLCDNDQLSGDYIEIIKTTAVVSGEYQSFYGEFVVPETGIYYLRIYGHADITAGYISLDDISIDHVEIVETITPPSNLRASVYRKNVTLEWDAPEIDSDPGRNLNIADTIDIESHNSGNSRLLRGYKVYRDDNWIATIYDINTLSYIDIVPDFASYTYAVTASYVTAESAPAGPIEVEVLPPRPRFAINPGEHDFGLTEINTSQSQTFTIKNDDDAELIIYEIAISGNADFSLSNLPSLPITLREAETATFDAVFTPTAVSDDAMATISITDNINSRDVHTVTLTGICYDPMIRQFPFFEGFEERNIQDSTTIYQWKQIVGTQYDTYYWTANSTQTEYNHTPRSGSWNATLKFRGESILYRPIMLEEGEEYYIELYGRQYSTTTLYSELGVRFGSEATVEGMNNEIIPLTSMRNGDYQRLYGFFVAPSSGVFYIGIHGLTQVGSRYLILDDITIEHINGSETLVPPNYFRASVDDRNISLTWRAPGDYPDVSEWVTWCNVDDTDHSFGSGGEAIYDVAHRYDVNDLLPFQGMSLTKMKYIPNEASCVYTAKVWTGTSANGPSTLIYSKVLSDPIIGVWNTVVFDDPILITATEELWIGYEIDTQTGNPVACDNGPVRKGKGNMIRLNNWSALTDLVPSYRMNWAIQGFVEFAERGTSSSHQPIIAQPTNPGPSRAFLRYQVYRNEDLIASINNFEATSHLDIVPTYGIFSYSVTALYSGGESIPLGPLPIEILPYPPLCTISPTSHDYKHTIIGTSARKRFSINNDGEEDLIISTIEIAGDNAFSLDDLPTLPLTIPGLQSVTFDVIFAPTIVREYSANITITDHLNTRYSINAGSLRSDDSQSRDAHTISLTGTGFDPTITVYPYFEDFDSVQAPAMPEGWTVLNPANNSRDWETFYDEDEENNHMFIFYTTIYEGQLNNWAISPFFAMEAGKEYRVSFDYRARSQNRHEYMSLYMGTSPTVESMTDWLWNHGYFNHTSFWRVEKIVRPTANGFYYFGWQAFSYVLQFGIFVDNIKVEELSPNPDFVITPDSWNTDETMINTQTSQQFTIRNYAGGELIISGIEIDGDSAFSLSNVPYLPVSLRADETKSFNVIFAPTEAGEYNATITITDNQSNRYSIDAGSMRSSGTKSRDAHTVQLTGSCYDPITTLPYIQNFDTVVAPALPYGWKVLNSDNEHTYWRTDSNSMYIDHNNSGEGALNDWVISPPVAMEAGTAYSISYKHRACSSSHPEKLALKVGTAPTADALTETLKEHIGFVNTSFQETSLVFIPDADGYYYFAWYAFSDENKSGIRVSNVNIDYYYVVSPGTTIDIDENTSVTIIGDGFVGAVETTVAPEDLTPIPNSNFIISKHQVWQLIGSGEITLTFHNDDSDNIWIAYLVGGVWVSHEIPAGGSVDIVVNLDAKDASFEFALGKGGNPTLPVELSSFSVAINSSNNPVVSWITESETGVNGFFIYRGDSEELEDAALISGMIEATNSSETHHYSFIDENIYELGSYYYWLSVNDFSGHGTYHGPIALDYNFEDEEEIIPEIPLVTRLSGAYPNPFNPETNIGFELAEPSEIAISIYNMRGQLVRSFAPTRYEAGVWSILWNGKDNNGKNVSSGIYHIRMISGKKSYASKAVLMK